MSMRLGIGIGLSYRGAAGSAPALNLDDLFASGEDGAYGDLAPGRVWTDTAGTTAAGVGDAVARVDDLSGNGKHLTQATAATRPILRLDGNSNRYLEWDKVDDVLTFSGLDLNGKDWDFGLAFSPDGGDVIGLHLASSSIPWAMIGQSGSSGTILDSSGVTQNAIYFDNVLSTATTRGQQYTLFQGATSVLCNFNRTASAWVPSIGKYNSGAFNPPGPTYAFLIREGEMNADQRALWQEYALAKAT